MVRKGVELLLRSHDIAVVGVAESVKYATSLIARRRPHVALVDIGLSDGTGIERATTRVHALALALYNDEISL